MNAVQTYSILLLPTRETAATELTLSEALAWMRGYNEIFVFSQREAVIAESHDRADDCAAA